MTDHFEGKLHAFRRTQDGVVISYVIHPNDVSAELATAALGTRYMIAFSQIGDDDKPLARSSVVERLPVKQDVAGSKPAASAKDRKPFNTLPLSQQAALRCNDQKFIDFLTAKFTDLPDDFDPAEAVRQICEVRSRSEFDTNGLAGRRWRTLNDTFGCWLTDQQFAEYAQ